MLAAKVNVQVDAFATIAVSLTRPPAAGTRDGAAVNSPMRSVLWRERSAIIGADAWLTATRTRAGAAVCGAAPADAEIAPAAAASAHSAAAARRARNSAAGARAALLSARAQPGGGSVVEVMAEIRSVFRLAMIAAGNTPERGFFR